MIENRVSDKVFSINAVTLNTEKYQTHPRPSFIETQNSFRAMILATISHPFFPTAFRSPFLTCLSFLPGASQPFQIGICILAGRLLQISRLLHVYLGALMGKMLVTNELLPEDNGTNIYIYAGDLLPR